MSLYVDVADNNPFVLERSSGVGGGGRGEVITL